MSFVGVCRLGDLGTEDDDDFFDSYNINDRLM